MELPNYAQCELKRQNLTQVAWIPGFLATLGRTLKIKENGTWEDGWKVVQVYATATRDVIDEYFSQHSRFSAVLD